MGKVIDVEAFGRYLDTEMKNVQAELTMQVTNLAAARQAVDERQTMVNLLQGKFAALKDAAARASAIQRDETQTVGDAPPPPPAPEDSSAAAPPFPAETSAADR